jgi:predicted nucleic acid-binding Zn ribbon protein
MPTPRTKSISTKVTDQEYAQFEALAGEQTISEWAREVLLKAAKPSPEDQIIVAEVLALRMVLLNVLFSIANHEPVTTEDMQEIINRADARKLAKALELLTNAATEPQGR